MSEDSGKDALYNLEFQRSVVKLYCTNVRFAMNYGILLKDEYFDTKVLKTIYNIISQHILAYEKELELSDLKIHIDNYIVSHGFTSEAFHLMCDEAGEVFRSNIKSEQFIIDQLVKFCREKELASALGLSVEILKKRGSYEEVLRLIDKAVAIGAGSNEGLKFDDLINLPQLYKEKYNPSKMVGTGFHRYDAALEGGFAPGELHVICSPPKVGKSTLACNIGVNAMLQRKNIFHVSLEIKEVDVMAKYATRLTGFTYSQLKTGDPDVYAEKIRMFNKYKPNLFINYWTEKTVNSLAIRSWVSRIRSQTGIKPDLLIVDYDDCLLPTTGSKDDMYGDAGQVYSDLIGIADHFASPVLSFAQPRREAWGFMDEGKLIHSFDLAHSALKAHKCYSISSMNFKEDSDVGTLFVDRVRRGESNVKITIQRDLTRGIIREVD